MNMRVQHFSPETRGIQPQKTELVIDPQDVASQPSGPTVDYEEILNAAYGTKKQDPMKEALERLRQEQAVGKEEQMKQDWEKMEDRNRGIYKGMNLIAEESAYNAKRNDFNAGQQQAVDILSPTAQIEKKQQINTAFQKHEHMTSQEAEVERQLNERTNALETELLNTQEQLQKAYMSGDEARVAELQGKERDLISRVNVMRFMDPSLYDGSYQKAKESDFNNASFGENIEDVGLLNEGQEQTPTLEAVHTAPQETEILNTPETQTAPEAQNLGPTQNTLENLSRLGINYDQLVESIPNFASMSEGQQAYILYKAEQQSIEHIQSKTDNLFQEKSRKAGWFKRNFNKGALRREAVRDAVSLHTGLNVYLDDIARLTTHVEDRRRKIHLTPEGEYVIEYQAMPEGADPKGQTYLTFNEYNRAATALSDVPYEWSLSTASKKERKAFEAAYKEFTLHEQKVQEIMRNEKDEQGILKWDHGGILQHTHGIRTSVEFDQFFSTYPDVEKKLQAMKDSNWLNDMKGKMINPTTLGFVAGSVAGRWVSKAMFGLGGAMGAGAIIGGIMGWRKKKGEFTEDAKQVRKKDLSIDPQLLEQVKSKDKKYIKLSEEAQKLGLLTLSSAGNWKEFQKLKSSLSEKDGKKLDKLVSAMYARQEDLANKMLGVKDTTHKVFESDKNATRIYKLLTQLEKEQDPVRKQRTLTALEDRLKLLDERIREGRVNFGKPKDQIKNKQELIAAMAAAHEYRFSMTQEAKQVQDRVLQYFDAQDSQTQKTRNKEMVKAIAVGAGIGTTAAVAGYLIGGYFRNLPADAQGASVPPSNLDAVSARTPFVPPVDESVVSTSQTNPTDFEVSVDASSRGAIATFADLQEQLQAKYPDITQAPDYIQEFMSKTPTELAIEENMYRPTDASGDESAKIYKGGKLGFNKAGQLVYTDARTGVDILSGDGKFDGGHFDYGARQAATVTPANTGAQTGGFEYRPAPATGAVDATIDSSSPQQTPDTSYVVNNDRVMSPAEEAVQRAKTSVADELLENTSGGESIQTAENSLLLYGKVPVSYEIVDVRGGKDYIDFKNIDFNALKGIEKPYIRSGVTPDSFVDKIMVNEEFIKKHPDIRREKVLNDLNVLIREYALRDQVLQEGGFADSRIERRLLTRELEEIQRKLSTLERYAQESILASGDGPKFPNTTEFVGQATPVENPTSPVVENTPSSPNTQQETLERNIRQIETEPSNPNNVVKIPDSRAITGLEVEVSRDGLGRITRINPVKANINMDALSLGEYTQNRDWIPEYGQSKEKALGQLQILKGNMALRDAFPKGSPEYVFMQNKIDQGVSAITNTYPGLLEGVEGTNVSAGASVENPTVRMAPVETQGPSIAETSNLSGVSNEFLRDVTYQISKDATGNIVRIEHGGTVITNGINLQQIGFNPDWRTDSGLPQTFLDSSQGKVVRSKIEMIKNFVGLQSAFAPNSPEFNYYANQITTMKNNLGTQYPKMFQ